MQTIRKDECVFFLYLAIKKKRNGIARALLTRTEVFRHKLGVEPVIVTADYDRELVEHYHYLVENHYIGEETPYLNMYADFQGTDFSGKSLLAAGRNSPDGDDDVAKVEVVPNGGGRKYWTQDRQLIKYEITDPVNGRLRFINLFANKKIAGRLHYDSNGFLSRQEHIEPESGLTVSDTYFRVDGTPVIEKRFYLKGEKPVLGAIYILDRQGLPVRCFTTEDGLVAYWLDRILRDKICYVVIDQANVYAEPLLRLKRPNVFRIGILHSSHVVNQDNEKPETGRLNYNYKTYFEKKMAMSVSFSLPTGNEKMPHIDSMEMKILLL